MSKFTWERLLSQTRVADGVIEYPADEDRNATFHKDSERILTSSAFRRLQGKTQVYPLPSTDFVRNRLTHTYEVAHIGQTIAKRISKKLRLEYEDAEAFSQLVFNGCLLHDLGNPPFGHSGESSIREFFSPGGEGNDLEVVKNALGNEDYAKDLTLFDGNAQGFRIATKLAGWKERGGLRLSAGTLTAMVKYPFPSNADLAKKGKFGFMCDEQAFATLAFEKCGLFEPQRHVLYRNPLSLVVEAADDIAYLTSDVQDAYRYNDISFNNARQLLDGICTEKEKVSFPEIKREDKDYNDNVISYLRSAAVSRMIRAAADILTHTVFQKNILMQADEKFDLWNNSDIPSEFKDISISEEKIRAACNSLVYRGKRKISLQVSGGKIIKYVLLMQLKALSEIYAALHQEIFPFPNVSERIKSNTSVNPSIEEVSKYLVDNVDKFVSRESAQIFWGMPGDTHDILQDLLITAKKENREQHDSRTAYRIVQVSVDFVAGTTDRYLSEYSRQWSGPYISH
ncbi:dGTP triphosphohydrolase [Agrobacterium sp. NPDC090283]|uniref:dGTP triphosphohydrolase n=1 Tax=Agrobacterium sp. NPDC090283 TaxID=3363920 RepID=UPI00383B71D0